MLLNQLDFIIERSQQEPEKSDSDVEAEELKTVKDPAINQKV